MHWMSASRARMRPGVLIAVLALVAALVPVVPAIGAPVRAAVVPAGTTIYVDKSADGPGTGSADDPFSLLGDALEIAEAGDTIMVAAGVYGPDTGETLPFFVPSYVTVIGEYDDEYGWATELVGGEVVPFDIGPGPATAIMTLNEWSVGPVEARRTTAEVPEGSQGVVLKDLVFHSNLVDSGAAGLNAFDAQASIDNCAFFALSSYAGSAIFAEDSDVTITRSVFAENGGQPYLDRAVSELSSGIDQSEFRLDKLPEATGVRTQIAASTNYGGAVLAWYSTLHAEDTYFIYNSAARAGGAVLADSSDLTTNRCVFAANQAGSTGPLGYEQGSAELGDYLGTRSAEDWVDPFGGGAVCTLLGTYGSKSTIYGWNTANPGAAIVSFMNQTEIDQCQIWGSQGAAVVSFGANLLPTGFGSADYGVAAVEEPDPIVYHSGLDIDRSEFHDNDGFFTVYSTTQPSRVTNSEFAYNSSMATVAFEGGAVNGRFIEEPLPEPTFEGSVEGCTFTGNYADYAMVTGPIYDPIPLVNTIIWDNGDESWEPYYDATNVEAFNVVYQYELDATVQQDCFSEDPLFASPMSYDFRLAAGSPCIDMGTSAPEASEFESTEVALAWDLRPWDVMNLGRPLDGDGDGEALYDIGAHEFLPSGRVAGPDRYATAVETSKQHFGTSDTVVIATGRAFPDGLAGSGLAGLLEAPVLLTRPNVLPQAVADEIVRLGATKAFILGGTLAVSPAVEAQLIELGLEVERIGGATRYDTAAMIAEYVATHPGGMAFAGPGSRAIAFIARGDLYADALAVSPVAYANHIPVLLVQPDELPAHTVDVLLGMGINQAIVLGGDVAVSKTVVAQVAALADDVHRIDGANRYETAANIATWARDEYYADFGVTGIATGDDFADALSGGAAIGRRGGVLLLTPAAAVHPACEGAIVDNAGEIRSLVVIGGPSALSQSVYEYLMDLLSP